MRWGYRKLQNKNNLDDSRINRTKHKIFTGLSKLIGEKSIFKVTVAELCRISRIAKSTFYRHYDYIGEVIELKDIEIFKECLEVCYNFCRFNKIEYSNFLFKPFLGNDGKIEFEKVKNFCNNPKDFKFNKNEIPKLICRKIAKSNFKILATQINKILENNRKHLSKKISDNNFNFTNWFVRAFAPAFYIIAESKYPRSRIENISYKVESDLENLKTFFIGFSDIWQNEKDKEKRKEIFIEILSEKLYRTFNV